MKVRLISTFPTPPQELEQLERERMEICERWARMSPEEKAEEVRRNMERVIPSLYSTDDH